MNDYFYVNPRYKIHDGVVLDIGCVGWNWSEQFAGQKAVIGVDPDETTCPTWAKLVRKAVALSDGTAIMRDRIELGQVCPGENSLLFNDGPARVVETVSIQALVQAYPLSIAKLNIEGAEYPLLMAMKHPVADQLVVSFHDTGWLPSSIYPPEATVAMISFLSNWYTPQEIYPPCKWWLFLRR